MTTELKIDWEHTAVLSLHLQRSTLIGTKVKDDLLDRAAAVLSAARRAGIPVIHQIAGFRAGYPEVSPRNQTLQNLKPTGLLQPGMESAEIHPKVAPQSGEVVVTGSRGSAFVETDMGSVLRAMDIISLVILGISTGGSMVHTVASAADGDYVQVMVEDCCADADEELHRVLFQKLFPRRGAVVSSQELIKALERIKAR